MPYGFLHAACDVKRIPFAKIMDEMCGGDAAVFKRVNRMRGEDRIVINLSSERGLL